MVKIIKKGKLPADKEYEKTCPTCKTQFSFLRAEAKYVSVGYTSDPRDVDYLTINCPLCKETLTQYI